MFVYLQKNKNKKKFNNNKSCIHQHEMKVLVKYLDDMLPV